MKSLHHRALVLLPLVTAIGLLGACNRQDDRTVGQKTDDAIAQAEKKADQVGAGARDAARDAGQAIGNATDAAAAKAKDIAITAEVKTRLAKDDKLHALAINVDTSAGRVVLRGTAPDPASRLRATELAQAVEGVISVANELEVRAG